MRLGRSMRRAFVTGGSGFLGRHLIAGLRSRGVEVVALARSGDAADVVQQQGAVVARGDLDDLGAMVAGMQGCEVVFHAAAFAKQHGPRDVFFRVNVEGTRNVLRAAREAGVARFVHVGTDAALADGRPIVRADESQPLAAKPAGLYPLTKGLAEREVLAANRDGLATVVIRPRMIWGPDDTTLLPEIVGLARAGRWAWLGGGRYLTSTCHVDNVVEGALLAAERGKPGEVYFLTDGEPVEFRGFLTRMLATAGVDAS